VGSQVLSLRPARLFHCINFTIIAQKICHAVGYGGRGDLRLLGIGHPLLLARQLIQRVEPPVVTGKEKIVAELFSSSIPVIYLRSL
jgi:hypothetical protein